MPFKRKRPEIDFFLERIAVIAFVSFSLTPEVISSFIIACLTFDHIQKGAKFDVSSKK
jgi:hypothetical protein